MREVRDERVHGELGTLGEQRVGRARERALTDIDRYVRVQLRQRLQQMPRLVRRARPQLDQGPCPGGGRDLPGTGDQDLPLGTRRVVLVQPGDLLEQITAARVVEPLGRQRLRVPRQTAEHIGAQRRVRRVGGQGAGQQEGLTRWAP